MKLVFVHLNTKLPVHLVENLRRTQLLFPESEVFLITNFRVDLPSDFRTKIYMVNEEDYLDDFDSHAWDKNFRGGFWQSSLMRIFVLKNFHDLHPMEPILHIESDVILLPEFPMHEIARLNNIYWNSFGDGVDVGALIYSPNSTETSFLVSTLREELRENSRLTDMTALFLAREKDQLRYRTFPTSRLDDGFDLIPYIFDGAALGMWLLGQDPRNHYGHQPRFRNLPESHYKFDRNSVVSNENGSVRLVEGQISSPIVSLHVHCKDKRLFSLDVNLLTKRIRQSQSTSIPLFNCMIFLQLFVGALRTGNLKSFIYNFPLLGTVLKFFRVNLKNIGVLLESHGRKGK